MAVESSQRAIQRHQQEIARLQRDKSRAAAAAAAEKKRANSALEAAARLSSTSSKQTRLRDGQRHQAAAVQHEQKVADIESKLAREQGRLNDAHKQLAAAQDEQTRQRMRQQERAAREQKRRLEAIGETLTDHDELHRATLSAIDRLQQLPAQITVLFLAANPLDQQPLRLDEEVRSIGEMIRKSAHRESVRLESRWAVRPLDVLQAINESEPCIVHFSAHGSTQDEIVFQDSGGNTKLVSKEAIVQTMAAASGTIQLVFFNTCYSRSQAEAVVQHVPAAIGMNTSLGDEAARVFSAQFYSAVGFGLSIGQAFQQAKAALMLEGIREESTPELFIAAGLTADALVLVRPEER